MVTEMPKPDLLCLVQLLDGTIETFRVSVCNLQTRCTRPLPARHRGSYFGLICLCVSLMIVGLHRETVADLSYTIDPHLTRCDLGLKDILCGRFTTYIASNATLLFNTILSFFPIINSYISNDAKVNIH